METNDLEEAGELLDKLVLNDITAAEVWDSPVLTRIKMRIEEKKTALSESRTSRLWLQYMDMIAILQRFIRAERTGNWDFIYKPCQKCCHILLHQVIIIMQSQSTFTFKR